MDCLRPPNVRDVLDHHGAGTNHHIVADGDAGTDDYVAAEPNVAADGDGSGSFRTGGTYGGVDRMIWRIGLLLVRRTRGRLDGDLRDVEEDAVHIGIEVVRCTCCSRSAIEHVLFVLDTD